MRSSTSARPFGRVIATATTMAIVASAAIAVVGLSAPAALAASNTPPGGSHVPGPGCGTYQGTGFWVEGATPSLVNSGDYTGNVVYGNTSTPACVNTTAYILDVAGNATSTFVWEYGANQSSSVNVQGDNCSAWAYIPTVDAGDQHARYDMWGVTSTGVRHWLSWPGHTVDQETTSGWIYLGSAATGGYATFAVTLTNSDPASPGWYTGAGAMAISCTPVAAQVPTGVTATATGPDTIQVKWSDPSGGNNKFVVTNDVTSTAQLTYGTTSYTWGSLVPGTYMCFAVQAVNSAGTSSAWSSPWACATTPVPVATGVTATATGPAEIALKWTDNTGGTAKYLVTDGAGNYSPTLPAGTTSYTWTTGLASNTYKCLAVLAEGPNASSGWSQWACATTPWSETDARNDLLSHLASTPLSLKNALHDDKGNTMDTAKVIQTSPGNYLAVYATGNVIKLATSTDLLNWHYVNDLDTPATQPYIAQGPNSSFMLADEQFDQIQATSGPSHVNFMHYSSLSSLLAGQSDWFALPPPILTLNGPRFFSLCNEGTPDIHGISQNGLVINFGFHYNSNCGTAGPDREAYGTFTVTSIDSSTGQATATWSATKDTVRDNAAATIGYTGSRGGRDDITWHGWRFSIQEAQCGSLITTDCTVGNTNYDYTSWRYILYDYSNHQAYPATIPPSVETVNGSVARCHGNPKITALNDPGGTAILVITGFIFGPGGGCVPSGTIGGEFLYTVSAS